MADLRTSTRRFTWSRRTPEDWLSGCHQGSRVPRWRRTRPWLFLASWTVLLASSVAGLFMLHWAWRALHG